MLRPTSPTRLVLLLGIAVASACSSGSTTTAPPAAAATISALASQVSAGCSASMVPDTPVVVVKDAGGSPVGGASVTFAVASGGGTLSATSRTTNAQGRAGVAWTLGSTGIQTVTATSGSLTPVTFSATSTGSGPFCIELIYTATPDPLLRVAADSAAVRWSRIIKSTMSTEVVSQVNLTCAGITGITMTNKSVQGLLIYMQLAPITSTTPGLITLGSSGPCLVRSANGLTVVGGMRLNSDYLLNKLSALQRTDVVLHEMGHSLGFGTLWSGVPSIPALPVLLAGSDTVSRHGNQTFTGAAALQQYKALGASSSVSAVPVENCGGGGTLNGHWREDAGASAGFGTELMTGYISAPAGQKNPLSKLTIASMKDMGYVVDSTQADPYTLNNQTCPAPLLYAPPSSVVIGTTVVDEQLYRPTHVVRGGVVEPIIRK